MNNHKKGLSENRRVPDDEWNESISLESRDEEKEWTFSDSIMSTPVPQDEEIIDKIELAEDNAEKEGDGKMKLR